MTTLSIIHRPDFDGFVKTLFGGRAGFIPLIELGVHPLIKEQILGRPIKTVQDDIEFMRSMGYDFVKIQPIITLELNRTTAEPRDVQAEYRNSPDRAWASENKGLITTWEELEKYPWPTTRDIDYSRLEEARSILPHGMGIIGQYGDIFTNAWELMGFETFAMSTYEQPELVRAIYQKMEELILSMFDTMARMEWVGALWYSDDIAYSTGLMANPEFFREHFFPTLKHIGDLARSRGIPLIYHTDGVLWDVMDDIIGSGVTSLHPIEPKSMDIREVKRRYGDKLCLCGGIEVDLLARGTPGEVSSLVTEYIRDVGQGGGWCAGSSNSIPEYVKVENYLRMVETVLQHNARAGSR